MSIRREFDAGKFLFSKYFFDRLERMIDKDGEFTGGISRSHGESSEEYLVNCNVKYWEL